VNIIGLLSGKGGFMKRYWRRVASLLSLISVVVVAYIGGGVACSYSNCSITLAPSEIFTLNHLQNEYGNYGYVAHALGSVEDLTYTNCKEAFELSYQKGFRFLEVDLVLLKDGTVFCAHDGQESNFGLDKPFSKTTINELKGKLYRGNYTPLDGSGLLNLLNQYEDAFIILDTKYDHTTIIENLVAEAKRSYPSVIDRMIPLIAGKEDLCEIHNKIYSFKDYVLALYRSNMDNNQVIEFVKDTNINAVMMFWDDRYTYEFRNELEAVNAVTYVHRLNDPEKIESFRQQGVGVFSDGYFPE